jgi:hypothetical protein
MRWFNCDKFKCFFHLWSDGGPNWRGEFALWQKECAQECILVSPSKRTVQLGIAAMKKAAPKPAVKHTLATNRSLKLAPIIQYEACKGYSHIDISPSEKMRPYLTKTIPSIPFGTTVPWSPLEGAARRESPTSSVNSSREISASSEKTAQPEPTRLEEVVNDIAFRF